MLHVCVFQGEPYQNEQEKEYCPGKHKVGPREQLTNDSSYMKGSAAVRTVKFLSQVSGEEASQ